MAEIAGRPPTKLEPWPAWTVLTDAPLKGFDLAREAGNLFAWDEAGQLYLFDRKGRPRPGAHAEGRVIDAAISDDGSLVAVLTEGPRLVLLDAALRPIAERTPAPDSASLAVDPHGRYALVASRLNVNQFYTRYGRPAGRFDARQALGLMTFVPGRSLMVGAAVFGALIAVELRPAGSGGKLGAELLWDEPMLSKIGRVATTGDGGVILASCFNLGVQRYDLRGRNEGAYHLGGTATHAVPDFAGRTIAVATAEGDLSVLNAAGNIRWKTSLTRPAIALEVDPLGRYLVYGHDTGEIVRLELQGTPRPAPAQAKARPSDPRPGPRSASGSIRTPEWTVPAVASEEHAESAVAAVLDQPPRIALFLSPSQLQVYTDEGKNLGIAPEMYGVGRILRTAPGWVAASTDRQIVLFDARRNSTAKLDMSLVEITHLALRPDTFGLAVVQERDRILRATTAGRTIWKRELRQFVEDVAIGPDGLAALTTEDGELQVLSPAGEPIGTYAAAPAEALGLIQAPDSSPDRVAWLTLARRSQVLRGHDLSGKVVWESPVPWEAWHFQRLGTLALVEAPDGRALAFDGAGHLRDQGRPAEGSANTFGISADGAPIRISRQGVHLICTELSGRVRWRAVVDAPIGPVAVSPRGVAAFIGRSLAWFPDPDAPR